MSRGFNTTLGVGTTDQIVTGLSKGEVLRSYFFFINTRVNATQTFFGQRGTNYGVIYESAGTWNFIRQWTTQDGSWNIPKASNGSWHSLGMSYDASLTTNVPVFYVDGTKPVVTQGQPPIGSLVSLDAEVFRIGNRSAGDLALDGMIAECATWNCILTDVEFFALSNGACPAFIRPGSLEGYWPLRIAIKSRTKVFPTSIEVITGTKIQAHPPKVWRNRIGINSIDGILVDMPSPFVKTVSVVPPSSIFRKTASSIGTRTGTRQTWAV